VAEPWKAGGLIPSMLPGSCGLLQVQIGTGAITLPYGIMVLHACVSNQPADRQAANRLSIARVVVTLQYTGGGAPARRGLFGGEVRIAWSPRPDSAQ
jgi:hypothetical protein